MWTRGSENDDAEFNYRKDELVKWKNKDSAEYFKKVLKYFSESLIDKIEKKNENIIKLAVRKAREQKPYPLIKV